MQFFRLVSILSLLVVFSATKCTSNKNENMPIQLRIYNDTQNDMTELVLRDTPLGDLEKKQHSKYVAFDYGYAYDKISFKVDDDIFELIPMDFVGEEKLKTGNYTYSVSIRDFQNRIIKIDLAKD